MEGVKAANVFSGKISMPDMKNINPSEAMITGAKLINKNNLLTKREIETVDLSTETMMEKNTKPLSINELNYEDVEKDGYTVQGYTISDTNTYITSDGKILLTAYKKGYNSRIYVYNSETGSLEARITLPTDAHVGGTTFDSKNQVLYVTAKNGKATSYDYKMLSRLINTTKKDANGVVQINFSKEGDSKDPDGGKAALTVPDAMLIENNIDVLDTVNKGRELSFNKQQGMDTIYYYNGAIYSGTYSGNGYLIKTNIEYEKNPQTGSIISIKAIDNQIVGTLPPAVQGIAFYEENNKVYLVTASSAKFSKSRLTLFDMTNGYPIELGAKIISQSGLEGIYINNGEISGIFEYEEQKLQTLTTIKELDNSWADPINYAGLSTQASVWDLIHGLEEE